MYEIEQIKKTPIMLQPFRHIQVSDFFDPETYARILENWPENELQKVTKFSSQLDLAVDPGVERFSDGKLLFTRHLTGDKLKFWMRIRDRLCSRLFCNALLNKFGKSDMSYYPTARIVNDYQGSGLGPHTDRNDKIISCVICIDDNPEACPTMLLKANADVKSDGRHHGYDGFTVVKPLRYLMNSMHAWPVTIDSFHAFHQTEDTTRRSIKFFIQRSENVEETRKRIDNTRQYAEDWRKSKSA